jgi:hypothetical protein
VSDYVTYIIGAVSDVTVISTTAGKRKSKKIGDDIPITLASGMDEDDDEFIPAITSGSGKRRQDSGDFDGSSSESSGPEIIELDLTDDEIIQGSSHQRTTKKRKPTSSEKKRAAKRKKVNSREAEAAYASPSDGETAKRQVEKDEAEERIRQLTTKRGPKTMIRAHFHPPRPVVANKGAKRWSFKCRYCRKCVILRLPTPPLMILYYPESFRCHAVRKHMKKRQSFTLVIWGHTLKSGMLSNIWRVRN